MARAWPGEPDRRAHRLQLRLGAAVALDRGVVVAAARRGGDVLDIRSLQSQDQAVVPLPGSPPAA